MIPSRLAALLAPARPGSALDSDTANLDLFVYATGIGYSAGAITIEIPATVEIYSADPATPACVVGNFPPGAEVELIVRGKITGAGGGGGNASDGTFSTATPGQAGGHALDASAVSGFTFRLRRMSGSIIRSGGGGGGGGGAGVWRDFVEGIILIRGSAAGGGGGAGQGRVAGTPGLGKTSAGASPVNGAPGSGQTGGAGGSIADISYETGEPYKGGKGGNAGAYGAAGQAGTLGSPPESPSDTGGGGAAGKSINGIGNVVVLSSAGTLIGPTA